MTCTVHYVLHYAIKTNHRALSCIYVHATGRVIFSKDSRASESVVEQNYWLSTISNRQQVSFEISWSGLVDGVGVTLRLKWQHLCNSSGTGSETTAESVLFDPVDEKD